MLYPFFRRGVLVVDVRPVFGVVDRCGASPTTHSLASEGSVAPVVGATSSICSDTEESRGKAARQNYPEDTVDEEPTSVPERVGHLELMFSRHASMSGLAAMHI